MTLTEAQRNAIRSDAPTLMNASDGHYTMRAVVEIGCHDFDLPTVRALMRLAIEGEADRRLGAVVRETFGKPGASSWPGAAHVLNTDRVPAYHIFADMIEAIASALREEGEA